MNRSFLLVVVILVSSRILVSQNVTVTARIDSQSVSIGDWIRYAVQIRHPAATNIIVPSFKDTIGSFDIVRQDSVVTKEINGTVELSKEFVITRFDAGNHYIEPFAVQFIDSSGKKQTVRSNPIPVEVRGVEVDTTQAIRDVKPQLSVPMSAEEIALYIVMALAAAGAGYGLYLYLRKRKKNLSAAGEEKPNIPPHIIALMQLDELESKNLWKQGETKLFYSHATEIIRRYFERRYDIMALEMTTGEVMEQLKTFMIEQEIVVSIDRFLTDADLVKFAKYQPVASENESVIPAARVIVERTKPAETAAHSEQKKEEITQHV